MPDRKLDHGKQRDLNHSKWKDMKELSTQDTQGKHGLGRTINVEKLEPMEKVAYYCERVQRKVLNTVRLICRIIRKGRQDARGGKYHV